MGGEAEGRVREGCQGEREEEREEGVKEGREGVGRVGEMQGSAKAEGMKERREGEVTRLRWRGRGWKEGERGEGQGGRRGKSEDQGREKIPNLYIPPLYSLLTNQTCLP